jgi:hypothetical protein
VTNYAEIISFPYQFHDRTQIEKAEKPDNNARLLRILSLEELLKNFRIIKKLLDNGLIFVSEYDNYKKRKY